MWHIEPKNDAWREVHLAHVEGLGNRLWLRCNAYGHSMTPESRALGNNHHLDMRTAYCDSQARALSALIRVVSSQ